MGKHREKSKKHKSEKHKKKHKRRDSSDSSSGEEEWVEKKPKKKYRKNSSSSEEERISKSNRKSKKQRCSTSPSSSSSEGEEWVEKRDRSDKPNREDNPSHHQDKSHPEDKPSHRDEWLSLQPSNFLTASHLDRRKEREEKKRLENVRSQYNPRESVRELNPYWKRGGDGLPSASQFKKPSEDNSNKYTRSDRRTSNWRRKPVEEKAGPKDKSGYIYENLSGEQDLKNESSGKLSEKLQNDHTAPNQSSKSEEIAETSVILSDKELNSLAAKLVKAEIMGNNALAAELKQKLEDARQMRESAPVSAKAADEEVILTRTDAKGYSRPVQLQSDYAEPSGSRRKKQKVETHKDGERVRYFADDDKYSLKQMFENEKFNSVEEQNSQFLKLAGKVRKNDDLDDIFTDNIRSTDSDEKMDRRNKDRAVGEHQRMTQSLDSCSKCIQSMAKHLMVSMSESMYLTIPSYEPMAEGHCFIVPIRHVPCGTQLDENEWSDLLNYRKSLVKMFEAQGDDVVFFETAVYLNKYPHMALECVPLPKEQGDLAPIYFKKAIDESEMEWSNNKKLVSMAGKDVRRCIPKGLPYFCVSFGMQEGYAHVIEDEQCFPMNFAQEIVGGMLDLHHSKWRKPKRQQFNEQSRRVLQFSKIWKDYDHTLQ